MASLHPSSSPLTFDHESPRERWRLVRWAPPRLSRFVAGIWYFEGRLALPNERHYPNGQLDLVLQFGPRYRRVGGPAPGVFPRASASGPFLTPDVIAAPAGDSAALGIRLHPEGAIRLLGQPVEALQGKDADLADLLSPRETDELLDRCEGAGDPMARIAGGVRWMEERLARGRAAPRGVEEALLRLRETGGRTPISSLAEDSGWSRSRFSTRFREEVGLPPKTYARILRFHSALEALGGADRVGGESREASPNTPGSPSLLSRIAFRAGYADQAHFTRDFRSFAGTTPAAWLRRRAFPGSTSTPEPGTLGDPAVEHSFKTQEGR